MAKQASGTNKIPVSNPLSDVQGYYWHPTIHDDHIVFVSEDDLWAVSAQGGLARRLTSGPGTAKLPCLSPDGRHIAYVGTEQGNTEVYVMDAEGGASTRLTWQGRLCKVVGWTDPENIVFSSTSGQPFNAPSLFLVGLSGGDPEPLDLGPATFFDVGQGNASLLTRFQDDPARWKRYRGGRTGVFWVDTEGEGLYKRLLPDLPGNRVRAMWLAGRVVFLSDHEGIGNLYGCTSEGEDLTRLTHHVDSYARHPRSDGKRVVYHAGGDLWIFDPDESAPQKVDVRFRSPRSGLKSRFINTGRYLEHYDLHPEGHEVVITSRGKAHTMALWEGAVTQHGKAQGIRTRLTQYLGDGDKLIGISDEGGTEAFEIWPATGAGERRRYDGLDIGRVISFEPSPDGARVALSNHRSELLVLELDEGVLTTVDKSPSDRIKGFSWSPDSAWLAYSLRLDYFNTVVRLFEVAKGAWHPVTRPGFVDLSPSFDPKGRYLYFISHREYDPVYDALQFDLGFPRSMRLCLVLLGKGLPNPFVPTPRAVSSKDDKDKGKGNNTTQIDLEGIEDRVLAFPLTEGRFGSIRATENHVYYTSYKIEGGRNRNWRTHEPKANATLKVYDLKDRETRDIAYRMTSFKIGRDGKSLILRAARKIQVMPADGTNNKKGKGDSPSRKSGWVDLNRVKIAVEPAAEWRQMATEAWRLMGQQFWRADMGGMDWDAIRERYMPLIERVGARSEFSDVMWEMQGELGTSHAYEMGGDYPRSPSHHRGFLGAQLRYDQEASGARVISIIQGDNWDLKDGSPLGRPGSNVNVGDLITAIDGRPVEAEGGVGALLVNKASTFVSLTIVPAEGGEARELTVKTLRTQIPALYRAWVSRNRALVHEASGGKVGYIHVPNMGPAGYAEFHRAFLSEFHRPAMIVDVRYNGGGHVSQLLLQKLARKRIGHDKPRWRPSFPYPRESVAGPIVCLTNEHAGSDGDIFSHNFKSMGLGPLIGKRTWGGTIGIWPRHYLVDGGVTTQPEFSGWYKGVGFGLENHGTEVDIEVEITPQDYAEGKDPQLEESLRVVMELLEENPPTLPEEISEP